MQQRAAFNIVYEVAKRHQLQDMNSTHLRTYSRMQECETREAHCMSRSVPVYRHNVTWSWTGSIAPSVIRDESSKALKGHFIYNLRNGWWLQ